MSTQADERIQNSDTYLIGGDGFSDGFESVMPLPRESLPGGKVEVMDVDKDKLVCQASPVRSEAVPVEAAFDATSSLNPEEMPGCAEALSVQEHVKRVLVRFSWSPTTSHVSSAECPSDIRIPLEWCVAKGSPTGDRRGADATYLLESRKV